ncbi:MAG: hypothetical protein IKN54_03595 [Lachnospiraceae bacterium]|nr:hypothetical protein [Lachnospiraceae bacterium]
MVNIINFGCSKSLLRKISLTMLFSSAMLVLSGCAGSHAITYKGIPEFTTIHYETTAFQP